MGMNFIALSPIPNGNHLGVNQDEPQSAGLFVQEHWQTLSPQLLVIMCKHCYSEDASDYDNKNSTATTTDPGLHIIFVPQSLKMEINTGGGLLVAIRLDGDGSCALLVNAVTLGSGALLVNAVTLGSGALLVKKVLSGDSLVNGTKGDAEETPLETGSLRCVLASVSPPGAGSWVGCGPISVAALLMRLTILEKMGEISNGSLRSISLGSRPLPPPVCFSWVGFGGALSPFGVGSPPGVSPLGEGSPAGVGTAVAIV